MAIQFPQRIYRRFNAGTDIPKSPQSYGFDYGAVNEGPSPNFASWFKTVNNQAQLSALVAAQPGVWFADPGLSQSLG